jgi:erythromycin esterase
MRRLPILILLIVLLRPLVEAGSQAAPARVADVDRWISAAAIPLRSVELDGALDDLQPLADIVGRARVVALGESTHGAHEPLAFRNRLFRYLVERLGFTAIALETGFPESGAIAQYVAGGRGAPPPGDAARIARRGFTWGFGNFAENVELLRWMRAYNDDPRHLRKLRFYGIDLSLGGPQGSTPTPSAIEAALEYVARVDAAAARGLRARFAPLVRHLPGDPSSPISAAQHDSLTAAIAALVRLLETGRSSYATSTSVEEHAWALRAAVIAQQGDRVHRVQAPPSPDGRIAPGAWREIEARDSAMAENVRWALEREGPVGRVLVFAHDIHVKNAPTVGGPWTLERPPTAMGQHLRAALGDRLVIIGSVGGSKAPTDRASIDVTLAQARVPRFVLDLRRASPPAVRAWLSNTQRLGVNGDATIALRPGTAFDLLVHLGALTPARPNAP